MHNDSSLSAGLLALSRLHEAHCSTEKQEAFDCRVPLQTLLSGFA